jgi:ATP-binding cassette subfamily B protein
MKPSQDKSTIDSRHVVAFLTRESFKSRKLILALILMPISAFAIGTGTPYLISNLLAHLAQGTISDYATTGIALLLINALVGVISNRYAFQSLLRSQASTLERLQNTIFTNLLQKDRSYFANRMSGKLISDVLGFQNAMIQFQDLLAINALPLLTNLVFGIVIVTLQSWILGLGLLVISVIVIAWAFYSSQKRAPLRIKRHRLRRELYGFFSDVITNNSAVKIFANESQEKQDHRKYNKRFTDARIHDWSLVAIDGSNRIIGILLLQIAFIVVVINMVQADPTLLATGIFAFSFTLTLTNRLFEVSSITKGLEAAITDASSVVAILDNEPSIVDIPNAKRLKINKGDLAFETVDFRYADNQHQGLLFDKLDLRVAAGERVGLVGRSGGGKTTITNLLLRFNDIDGGQITIDGQNIAEVTQSSLRKNISYVPQEPLLFHRSLAENIAYGKPGVSQSEIERVAKLAHAHEFVKGLPFGYETLVGERGVKLSGGQRQRVAIARAMIKDAPIVVLDEATSALDSESEVLIQDALWKLMDGRTAIVIAHRLSTIQKMDRIIVLDEGRIVEQGTHQELIKLGGTYAGLWSHQSGGFLDD